MFNDCAGIEFGLVTVLEELRWHTTKHRRVRCRCNRCGRTFDTFLHGLRDVQDNPRTCGCGRKARFVEQATSHGLCRMPGYPVWQSAKQRCVNPSNRAYPNYGGRGIVMCDRWLNDFAAFYADMGGPPTSKHTLDRIDNDGPYSPENCRWVTRAVQLRNTRRTRQLTYLGETMCAKDWAIRLGLPPHTVHQRLKKGWPTVLALTAPLRFRPK